MSIALDLALMLRNSSTKFGLSLAARSILNALAFRVGTKANTWISQKTLAHELGITTRALRKHHPDIESSNIVQIKTNSRDKRKYLYSFNSIFFNYHQMKAEDRIIVHKKLKDTYDERHIKVNHNAQNRGTKVPVSAQNRGTKVPLNRGTKVPVVLDAQMPETLEPRDLEGDAQIPKGTYENNIKDKVTKISCAKSFAHAHEIEASFEEFWKTYPKKKDKERAKKIWAKHKLYEMKDQIIVDVIERTKKEQQWQTSQFIPHASTYLNNKLWTDSIESCKKSSNDRKENTVLMAFNHILGKNL